MRRWLGPVFFVTLLVVALVGLSSVAASTGIAEGEANRLDAAHTLGEWFDSIGSEKVGFFDQKARDTTFRHVHHYATPATLLSAFCWHVATSNYGWLSELLSLRLGYVLFSALALPLLYALVVPIWGRRAALLSIAFLAFVPRALHQATLADPEALNVSAWLLVLVCYAQARKATRERKSKLWGVVWSCAVGLALGFGVALSHGSLVVCIALMIHTLWAERRHLGAMLREGLLPVPSSLLAGAVFAPMIYFALTPWLWHDTAKRLGTVLVQAFQSPAAAESFTAAYGPLSVITSVPTVTLVAALVGLAAIVGPRRLREWATGSATCDDGTALIFVGLMVSFGWAAIAPSTLHGSPPRWMVALPFVAALAGMALDRSLGEVGAQFKRSKGRWAAVVSYGVLCLGIPLWQTIRQPSTRAAAYSPMLGGPKRVAGGQLRAHDGSVALGLVSTIDGLGRSTLTVEGKAVAADVWAELRKRGILRTNVRLKKKSGNTDLLVVGGGEQAKALAARAPGIKPHRLAVVDRDGAVLLELYAMKQ